MRFEPPGNVVPKVAPRRLPDRAVESHCMLPRRHSRLWRYVIWKSITQIEVSETSGSGLDGPT
jgi:hypothetical protein